MTLASGNIKQQIEHMLAACEDELNRLNKWEQGFIMSIRDQFNRNGFLSKEQIDKLEHVYVEKTP